MGEIKATPRNPWLGKLADALRQGGDFAAKPFGYDNPPGEYISQYLGVPSIATTLDRLSYGEPITNINKANVPLLKPETAEAAMAIAPMAIGGGNALIKAFPKAQAAALRMMDNAMAPSMLNKQAGAILWHGPNARNNLKASDLQDLISSQRYLDRNIVAQKIREGDFDVSVTPSFQIDGNSVRAIQDGHHALEAAIRSGNKPNFITGDAAMNDRIGLLKLGNIDGYLEAAYHDSPWYNFATKKDLF